MDYKVLNSKVYTTADGRTMDAVKALSDCESSRTAERARFLEKVKELTNCESSRTAEPASTRNRLEKLGAGGDDDLSEDDLPKDDLSDDEKDQRAMQNAKIMMARARALVEKSRALVEKSPPSGGAGSNNRSSSSSWGCRKQNPKNARTNKKHKKARRTSVKKTIQKYLSNHNKTISAFPNHIPFRFYNKKEKRYVEQAKGPKNVWDTRYKLDIWNNTVGKKHVQEMAKLVNKNKNFTLEIKVGSRYQAYTPKLGKEISKDKMMPRRGRQVPSTACSAELRRQGMRSGGAKRSRSAGGNERSGSATRRRRRSGETR
jgi:hypothetical protein